MKHKAFYTTDGRCFERITGWKDYKTVYNPSKRHQLYDDRTDLNGYYPGTTYFDETLETVIEFYEVYSRKISLNALVGIGSIACPGDPEIITALDGEQVILNVVDFSGDLFYPLYGELDEHGSGEMRFYQPLKRF